MSKKDTVWVGGIAGGIGFLIGVLLVLATVNKNTETVVEPEPAYAIIGGNRIPMKPGDEVEVEIEETGSQDGAVNINVAKGTTSGGDVITNISSFADNWQMKAPELNLDMGSVIGGEAAMTAKGLASKGHVIIMGLGALCFIGGIVVALWLKLPLGWYVAAAGLGLIIIGFAFNAYPWLALLLPVLGIAAVIWFFMATSKGKAMRTALFGVVKGLDEVEKAGKNGSPEAAVAFATVTKSIGGENDKKGGVIKDVVSKVKKKL